MSSAPQIFGNFDGRKMLALVGHWRSLEFDKIPSPIACSLDLSCAAECPNRCHFCNVKRTQPGSGHMTEDTFARVLHVFRIFGVKSCCVAGGGESLANPDSEAMLQRIVDAGTAVGVITNGRFYRKMPADCRFVNVSINAADPTTYAKMCGVKPAAFDEVVENICHWCDDGQQVAYKVLITDRNKGPELIEQSVRMAAKLGCKTVLFRFATLPWDKVNTDEPEYLHLDELDTQLYVAQIDTLQRAFPRLDIQMPLERYDRRSRKYTPAQCSGGLVNFVVLFDGSVVLCSDYRSNPAMKLCEIKEFSREWGGEKHRQILAAVDPAKCPRCSFLIHDTILQQFVYRDVSNQYFI